MMFFNSNVNDARVQELKGIAKNLKQLVINIVNTLKDNYKLSITVVEFDFANSLEGQNVVVYYDGTVPEIYHFKDLAGNIDEVLSKKEIDVLLHELEIAFSNTEDYEIDENEIYDYLRIRKIA